MFMKKSFKAIKTFFCALLVVYLFLSYFTWNLNPAQWGGIGLRYLVLGVICYGLLQLPSKTKEN